ncbi:Scr1 family TA system antitoxin-like transcriptional regulator [Streptomyces sp. NPDC057565]|uniref:Scr1 family TA system antitoxin-like transcriptional regulator n=1 Tax=Streptomyces sp. NPDC057565 TaxID=3346169 RepID=UPI00369425AB
MTSEIHPVARVVGGNLRDARKRRFILPEEAAELLSVSVETLLAMEAGHSRITSKDLHRLCHLYRCPDDAKALRTLAHTPAAQTRHDAVEVGTVRDSAPGHHGRLAGCARQAREVRWLSTALIPPPLQTAAYARAVGCPPSALPGAPLPSSQTVCVLDERILHTHHVSPEVMAQQLRYLLDLEGDQVRVVPGRIAAPQGHLVELRMAAGLAFARPEHDGVVYLPPNGRLSALVSGMWDLTTSAATRELLLYAAQEQFGRAYVHAGAA